MECTNKADVKQMYQENVKTHGMLPLKDMQLYEESKPRSSISANQRTTLNNWSTGAAKSTMEEEEEKRKEINKEEENKHTSSTGINQLLADKKNSATTAMMSSLDTGQRKRKIDPTVRYWGKAGPSSRVSSSEDEEEYWVNVKRPKKQKHPFGDVKM